MGRRKNSLVAKGERLGPQSRPTLRGSRLVAAKVLFLEEIEALARRGDGETPLFAWPAVDELRRRLRDTAAAAKSKCREQGVEPADLPPPSRRAYQWMSFLSSDGRLQGHLRSLRILLAVDERVSVRMDHTGSLYRFERDASGVRLSVSEGFIGAPTEVLRSLVRLSIPYTRKAGPRRMVREFSEGPGYAAVLREIEASGGTGLRRHAGKYYDLRQLFDSVNRDYFGGRLEPPRLAWSERETRVEFGHYEPASDTVRLSRTLDAAEVPRFVLEHVLHHELLHRLLGAEQRNGRSRYHSSRFRREERRFRAFGEAEAFLRELGER